jgi:hypothetical protein
MLLIGKQQGGFLAFLSLQTKSRQAEGSAVLDPLKNGKGLQRAEATGL